MFGPCGLPLGTRNNIAVASILRVQVYAWRNPEQEETALDNHLKVSRILDHVVDDLLLVSLLGLLCVFQSGEIYSAFLQTPALLTCKLQYGAFRVEK